MADPPTRTSIADPLCIPVQADQTQTGGDGARASRSCCSLDQDQRNKGTRGSPDAAPLHPRAPPGLSEEGPPYPPCLPPGRRLPRRAPWTTTTPDDRSAAQRGHQREDRPPSAALASPGTATSASAPHLSRSEPAAEDAREPSAERARPHTAASTAPPPSPSRRRNWKPRGAPPHPPPLAPAGRTAPPAGHRTHRDSQGCP